MTSKCKICSEDPDGHMMPDETITYSCAHSDCVSNDLLSAQERIEKSAAYNHKLSASLVQAQEWLEQSRDENKALRELLDHVWCEGVDDYWVKNDGKKWQERLKELEIIPEKWPLKKGKNTN